MFLMVFEFLKRNLLEMFGGLLLILQGVKAMIPGIKDDEALDKIKALAEKIRDFLRPFIG